MSWQLGLARLASVTGGDLQRAARHAGGGARLWRAPADGLARHLRVDEDRLAEVLAVRAAFRPGQEQARLAQSGIGVLQIGECDYPASLDELPDPPFALFTLGLPLSVVLAQGRPVVAIVGSRRPTVFGGRFAHELAQALSARGAVIVSGLALGIDAAAHEGALAAGGPTVAVLGCGVDVPYPRRHRGLRDRIAAEGLLVSEYWPGTPPAPWRFPARNRIVAGLADAVVVVEAGERSGALITADFAMEQGRPVLAVPGAQGAAMAVGCNSLLRAGAGMCETPEDVVAELPHRSWTGPSAAPPGRPAGIDGQIYQYLLVEPLAPDEIAARVELGPDAVAAALARLELAGLILRGQAQRWWAAPLRGAA